MLAPMGVWSAARARSVDTPSGDVGRGISLDLARRRAKQMSGVRYDLSLDLTAKDTAVGSADIRFDRVGNSGDLVLDFRGPMLADLTVNGRPLSNAERIDGHLVLPAALRSVSSLAGLQRPWQELAKRVGEPERQTLLAGGVYLVRARVPAKA
jgi:aminopeptidase N